MTSRTIRMMVVAGMATVLPLAACLYSVLPGESTCPLDASHAFWAAEISSTNAPLIPTTHRACSFSMGSKAMAAGIAPATEIATWISVRMNRVRADIGYWSRVGTAPTSRLP